jgi:hypothetical protein
MTMASGGTLPTLKCVSPGDQQVTALCPPEHIVLDGVSAAVLSLEPLHEAKGKRNAPLESTARIRKRRRLAGVIS